MNLSWFKKTLCLSSKNLKILKMQIKQFEIWIADLNPKLGTEPRKARPVLVIQTDSPNEISHPSTLICPITTNVKKSSEILRVHIKNGQANVHQSCDIT